MGITWPWHADFVEYFSESDQVFGESWILDVCIYLHLKLPLKKAEGWEQGFRQILHNSVLPQNSRPETILRYEIKPSIPTLE
jgi:hypothetical protein